MSADVGKFAVVDPRIVQQKPTFAVEKGALSLTNVPFNAIANSSSQQSFQIQVPSENVFVDRAVDWTSVVNLVVSFTNTNEIADQAEFFSPAKDFALAPFPLHSLVSTMSSTINDTTVTVNTSDVLPQILRLVDLADCRRQRTCPTMLDRYVSQPTPASSPNSPLSGYSNAFRSDEVPNGAWGQLRFFTSAAFTTPLTNGVSVGGVYEGIGGDASGYGTIPVADGAIAAATSITLYLQFRSTEKLVLPPFIFGDEYELSTGLFGVQNMQLLCNIQAPTRVLRTTNPFYGAISNWSVAYAAVPFPTALVNIQFLTPSLDVPLPPKSVVPYMEFPRFITTQTSQIAAGTRGPVSSNTITLPNIPDYLYIYAKPQQYTVDNTSATAVDPSKGDWLLPFTQISVNFDNFSGLLSSATQEQLYKMSINNGLDMDYASWTALGTSTAYNGSIGTSGAPLVGGGLLLRPSRDIVLQAGQAPSLVGNFTFQFNATVYNPSSSAVAPFIYVVAISSGFFETIKGSSRIIKGVLTEQDILSASAIAPVVSDSSLQRLVGAGKKSSGMHAKKKGGRSALSDYT
jgi:hypothetical protein